MVSGLKKMTVVTLTGVAAVVAAVTVVTDGDSSTTIAVAVRVVA